MMPEARSHGKSLPADRGRCVRTGDPLPEGEGVAEATGEGLPGQRDFFAVASPHPAASQPPSPSGEGFHRRAHMAWSKPTLSTSSLASLRCAPISCSGSGSIFSGPSAAMIGSILAPATTGYSKLPLA